MEYASMTDVRNVGRDVGQRMSRSTGSALSRMHDTLSPSSEVNVGDLERLASTVAGGVLIAKGLGRGSLFGALMAIGGGALIHRGMTGHCAVYGALGKSTAETGMLGRELPRFTQHATQVPYDMRSFERSSTVTDDTVASAASGA